MAPHVLAALDTEWPIFAASTAAKAAVRRWAEQEPEIGRFGDLNTLCDELRHAPNLEQRDELWLACIRLARNDIAARRLLMQALLPGLLAIALRYETRWGRQETASMVAAAAISRIAGYPAHRTRRPAANLIHDTRHELYLARLRDVVQEQVHVADELPTNLPQSGTQPHPAEEVVELITAAVARGRISTRDARTILLSRVLGVRTAAIAEAEGVPKQTLRQQRRRAENALAAATEVIAC
jgi:hypothetical protein